MINASLIISFYKQIDFLKLVLASVERQSFKNFEVIIADDGSPEEIIKEIEKLSEKVSFPLTHLWQEDKGFRKNKILNKAIISSQSDFLIFIDGDCILHSEFVKEHFINKSDKICSTGRRVNLSEKISGILTPEKIYDGFLEKNFIKYFSDSIIGKTAYAEKGIYLKNNFLRKVLNKKKRGLLGCNFSIIKDDILKINGFDERYEAPSIGEDTDIQYRLELNGVKIKSLNHVAVQYHLFHELQERVQKNLDLFNEVKESQESFTKYGIIKK